MADETPNGSTQGSDNQNDPDKNKVNPPNSQARLSFWANNANLREHVTGVAFDGDEFSAVVIIAVIRWAAIIIISLLIALLLEVIAAQVNTKNSTFSWGHVRNLILLAGILGAIMDCTRITLQERTLPELPKPDPAKPNEPLKERLKSAEEDAEKNKDNLRQTAKDARNTVKQRYEAAKTAREQVAEAEASLQNARAVVQQAISEVDKARITLNEAELAAKEKELFAQTFVQSATDNPTDAINTEIKEANQNVSLANVAVDVAKQRLLNAESYQQAVRKLEDEARSELEQRKAAVKTAEEAEQQARVAARNAETAANEPRKKVKKLENHIRTRKRQRAYYNRVMLIVFLVSVIVGAGVYVIADAAPFSATDGANQALQDGSPTPDAAGATDTPEATPTPEPSPTSEATPTVSPSPAPGEAGTTVEPTESDGAGVAATPPETDAAKRERTNRGLSIFATLATFVVMTWWQFLARGGSAFSLSAFKDDDDDDAEIRKAENQARLFEDPTDQIEALTRLYSHTVTKAEGNIRWYTRNAKLKKGRAQIIRLVSLTLLGMGSVTPILIDLMNRRIAIQEHQIPPSIASLIIAAGTGLIALDRFWGYSTAWMRFLTTEMQIKSILETFEFDWHTQINGRESKSAGFVEDMINRCATLRDKINSIVHEETRTWVDEFQASLRAYDSNLKSVSDTSKLGSVNITVTNGPAYTDGWDILVDERRVTMRKGGNAAIRNLSEGQHSIGVRPTGDEIVHDEKVIHVSMGQIAELTLKMVEKGASSTTPTGP